MSRPRPRRPRAILATGLGLALFAMPAAPAQARTACSKLRQSQVIHAPVSWRYKEQLSRTDNGILQVRTLRDESRVFAKLSIGGATCKLPGGPWIVVNPIGVGYGSAGVDAVGNIKGSGRLRGWGIGIRGGAGGISPRMALQVMHCGRDNFFKTLKAIVGVPLPYLPFTFSAALWVGGQFLPDDKVVCGNVGVKRLRVVATSTGRLRLADLNSISCCQETLHVPSPNGGWNFTRSYRVGPTTGTAG